MREAVSFSLSFSCQQPAKAGEAVLARREKEKGAPLRFTCRKGSKTKHGGHGARARVPGFS